MTKLSTKLTINEILPLVYISPSNIIDSENTINTLMDNFTTVQTNTNSIRETKCNLHTKELSVCRYQTYFNTFF